MSDQTIPSIVFDEMRFFLSQCVAFEQQIYHMKSYDKSHFNIYDKLIEYASKFNGYVLEIYQSDINYLQLNKEQLREKILELQQQCMTASFDARKVIFFGKDEDFQLQVDVTRDYSAMQRQLEALRQSAQDLGNYFTRYVSEHLIARTRAKANQINILPCNLAESIIGGCHIEPSTRSMQVFRGNVSEVIASPSHVQSISFGQPSVATPAKPKNQVNFHDDKQQEEIYKLQLTVKDLESKMKLQQSEQSDILVNQQLQQDNLVLNEKVKAQDCEIVKLTAMVEELMKDKASKI